MTTTGELRAIIEELELVDIGDAASYLGEEAAGLEDPSVMDVSAFMFAKTTGFLAMDDRTSYPQL